MTSAARACIKAIFWGSVTGGGPFLILTLPLGISLSASGELAMALAFAFLPLIISGTVVIGAFVLLGLPLTAFLANEGDEKATTYATAGAGLGAILPFAFGMSQGNMIAGLVLAVPGGLAGLVTGSIWGRWREARRTFREVFN